MTGWDALVAWGPGRVLHPVRSAQGVDARLVELDGRRGIARLGRRDESSLDWELALLRRLAAAGVTVPRLVPTRDGRDRVGTMVVVEEVVGERPETSADWELVATMVRQVHRATVDWPQRPGRCTALELVDGAGDDEIDPSELPDDVRATCAPAWSRLAGAPTSVVVADLAAANVRLTDQRPVILDWGSAHVDAVDLDLVALPEAACPIHGRRRWTAAQAAAALAATATWDVDPDEAKAHLAAIDWP